MANNDRLADLYYRRIHSPEAQDACRDRVHWLCKRVEGPRVLDIGCSQGVVSLILGRESCTVVGLDVEAGVIEAAQQALREESEPVRQRVSFRVADAFAADFEPGSFDTVILGEVLEHLSNPERLLERVCQWLRPGGRVVISVPHGYEPHEDHKRTLYVLRLVDLLSAHFELTEIEPVHAKYLCAVGLRPAKGTPAGPPPPEQVRAWVKRCEEALESVQRSAHQEKLALQADRKSLSERAAQYRESIAALQKASDELRQQARAADTALTQDQDARTALAKELSELRRGWDELKRRQVELTQQAEQDRGNAEQLRAALQDAQQRCHAAEARAEALVSQKSFYQTELALREEEVRYQLGDALIRALRPSRDTLKLPFRIVRLLLKGLERRRQRREAKQGKRTAMAAPAAATGRPTPPVQQAADPKRQAGRGARTTPNLHDLNEIPTLAQPFSSTPPELRRRNDLCIAAVSDEFSWRAWQYEADVYTFTPRTWQQKLSERKPDLLLIESTWSGIDDSWYFQLRDLGKRGEVIKYYAVPDVVAWCRQRQIPTVFYNKEDPPNFDVFIDAARQFDYVFTSDANCIPAYRKHLGHERVFALPFAAQPRIHNPIMTGTRTGSVCFAGTWYAHRHFARHEDANKVLRPALNYDLHIFDRMAHSTNPNYHWPDEYLTAVHGSLSYAQMLAAYKRYRVFLNINSVRNSPTMFSRRVFELLACGTPVISSYADGIAQLLGPDVVLMSDDEQTTHELLERVLGDEEYRERLALRGQRKVFSEHTYTNRLQTLLKTIGLGLPPWQPPVMTMIAPVENADQVASACEAYRRQAYENKRLAICATRSEAAAWVENAAGADPHIRLIAEEGALWGNLLQHVVDECSPSFLVALNPAHYYGQHYLTDYANATLYVTEPAIGKATFYEAGDSVETKITKPGSEYRVVSAVNPWTLCLPHAQAQRAAARLHSAQTPHEWWNRAMRDLERVYSADRFNYVDRGNTGTAPAAPHVGAEPRELEAALA